MTTPDEKTFATLTKLFEEEFGPIGDRQVLYVHAPGRSEISGNHTDHEGGHVIAGSLDVAVDGIAVATDSNKIRVADEGLSLIHISLPTLRRSEATGAFMREDVLETKYGTRPNRPVGSEYPCCYSALPTELRLVMRCV